MILDERLEFADAVAVSTSATGMFLVGDVIDISVSRDIGNGHDLYLGITVDTAFTSTGTATVEFMLVSDDAAAINTTGSASVHFSSGAIATASLTAGAKPVFIALPQGTYERYVGVIAEVGTTKISAGKINAFLTPDKHGWKAYADASN